MARRSPAPSPGLAHIVTVGTTPAGSPGDVVRALASDIRSLEPGFVSVLATVDAKSNAELLVAECGVPAGKHRIVLLASHHALDEAFQKANEELYRLEKAGYGPDRVVVHYTSGSKVVSAAAVLAAVSHDVKTLRYLLPGVEKNDPSKPVRTTPRAVLAGRELREATALLLEMRFRQATLMAERIEPSLLSRADRAAREAIATLAPLYGLWDNLHAAAFVEAWPDSGPLVAPNNPLAHFAIPANVLPAMKVIARAQKSDGQYPLEILHEVYNSVIRRIREQRLDDALARLYRTAELYAQHLLLKDCGIRSDNVDIRRVPPRKRTFFEAQRRLDDTTIKLGLRASFELLNVLSHPVGISWASDTRFHESLKERREQILAHGTKPCSPGSLLRFEASLRTLILSAYPKFFDECAARQFPWVDNAAVLESLRAESGERSDEVVEG